MSRALSSRSEPRWARRKQARPEEITGAALELFVERGYAATRLEDVAARAGVDFVLRNSASPEKHQIETMVSGVAVFDYNNDGYLDLFVASANEDDVERVLLLLRSGLAGGSTSDRSNRHRRGSRDTGGRVDRESWLCRLIFISGRKRKARHGGRAACFRSSS